MEGRTRLVLVGPHGTGLSAHAACEIRHAPGEERQVLERLHKRLSGGKGGEPREDLERAAEILEAAKRRGLRRRGVRQRADAPSGRSGQQGARRRGCEGALGQGPAAAQPRQRPRRHRDRRRLRLPGPHRSRDLRGRAERADGSALPDRRGRLAGELRREVRRGSGHVPAGRGGRDRRRRVPGRELRGDRRHLHQPRGAGAEAAPRDPAARWLEAGLGDPLQAGRAARGQGLRARGSPPRSWPSSPARCPSSRAPATRLWRRRPSSGSPRPASGAALAAPAGSGRAPRSETPSADYPFSLVVEFDEFAHRATPLSSQVRGLGRIEPAGRRGAQHRRRRGAGDRARCSREGDLQKGPCDRQGAALGERSQPGVVRMVGRGGDGSPAADARPPARSGQQDSGRDLRRAHRETLGGSRHAQGRRANAHRPQHPSAAGRGSRRGPQGGAGQLRDREDRRGRRAHSAHRGGLGRGDRDHQHRLHDGRRLDPQARQARGGRRDRGLSWDRSASPRRSTSSGPS